MFAEMEKYAELKAYSDAQHRTILELNRTVNALEKETVELRRTVASTQIEDRKEKDSLKQNLTDEQAICEMQLSILRDRSLEGELSLEESKKVEIFARLLLTLRNPGKKQDSGVQKMDSTQLLKLIDGGLTDATDK